MNKKEFKEKFQEKKKIFLEYLVKTTNGMAYGLFSTLIIGTIISTVTRFLPLNFFLYEPLIALSTILKLSTGVGIGMGIALSLKLEGLKMISAAIAGGITAYCAAPMGVKIGDPLAIYIVVVITITVLNLVLRKKTPIDIIIIPLFGALVSLILAILITKPIYFVTSGVGSLVEMATTYQPLLMGAVIAVLMGMALTGPISSAAIALSLPLGSLAFGASVVGCSVQMIGFAVMSRKDNSFAVCLSVGIGTSMLQFKNIIRKPLLWLPTIIVSAILGALATTVFMTECSNVGAGMGTSGLVGPLETLGTMNYSLMGWLSVGLLMIILPLLLVWLIDIIFRKYNLIKLGDLKI